MAIESSSEETFNALKYRHVAGVNDEYSFPPGTIYWLNDKKQLHRTNGPSIECLDGTKYWHRNGKLHRMNAPAIEFAGGSKQWYVNGQFQKSVLQP